MPPTLANGKKTLAAVLENGGELVRSVGAEAPEIPARFPVSGSSSSGP